MLPISPRVDKAQQLSEVLKPFFSCCAMFCAQASEAGRAALAELLTVPDLSGLGISSTTADLLTVLTLLDSINR